MLTALSSITSNQAKPTEETMDNIKLILDYTASHQNAILTYQASDMVLIIHSNASYLSEPEARSQAGGHFSCHLMSQTHTTTVPSSTVPSSSKRQCLQRQKPNWVHYISTGARQSRCGNSSQKWAKPNRVLPFKPTTVQHVES
jgi:hypothetical protein